MSSGPAQASFRSRQWTRRVVPWAGGLLIGATIAMAAYDIVRSYRETVSTTGRELDAQARTLAEQTARSVQAVDVVLRHFSSQYRAGTFATLSPADIRAYLVDQSVGLVQIDGMGVFDHRGLSVAGTLIPPSGPPVNVGGDPQFESVRNERNDILLVGGAMKTAFDQRWIFPLARRLETPSGEFAGVIAARGHIRYYQQLYRDVRPDPGTSITLMHRNGTLVARHPPVESALGKEFPAFNEMLNAYEAGGGVPLRAVSPVDHIDRFGSLQHVANYPLTVLVTRDASVALAPWRAQALGTAFRTLVLSALAAILLAVVTRQLSRLYHARESLESSQERFALAVAGSNDGIVDWDIVNDRMYTSKRAMEIVGIDSDVTLRSRAEWRELVRYHPDDLQRMKDHLQSFLEGQTDLRDGEYRVLLPNGEYRWIRHRNKCVRDENGNPTRVAGSVSDIDAQKRAEAALQESQERYQLAVAGSNQGLWDWDLVRDTLFLSARAQEFMGLTPSEPLRARRAWVAQSTYHPDDVNPVRTAISQHLHGATAHFSIEYRLRHPSGDWHWYRQRGVALRDDRGHPYRMAGSMEDITEHKNAEAERLKLEAQLLQAKKLEAIGTLAGGIAHDFNNILAAILGNGEMAQLDAAEGTPLRRHVDAVVSAGMRAKSLVERILAFSRSGVGERVPVHVESVIAEALELVSASLPPHVRLDRRLAAGDTRVMGDPTQIHQVVMNLCTNAVHAMKSEGTLNVTVDRVEKTETVAATSALSRGSYVRLSVSDTGTGIAPNVLDRIFDPFFTTKKIGVGTGLGLSLVHGIVTDLGGGIDVESRVGQGTTFTVYLPASSSLRVSVAIEEIVPNGHGETILLVDDEEGLVRLGEEMLAKLGYEAVGFTSSIAALAEFRTSPARYHAVLSDESMPDMSGTELAREIAAMRPDVPIILMSGFVSTALSARAETAGIVDVLSKPLVARDIGRSLAAALRRGAVSTERSGA